MKQKQLGMVTFSFLLGVMTMSPQQTIMGKVTNNLSFQQLRTVTGSVTDENGDPIIGATVRVKGTQIGTTTNLNGVFSLDAANGNVIVISYVGMHSQEVQVGNTPIKVTLRDNSKVMDEVVVVGYGTMKKKDLTGAVASVDEKAFTDLALSDVSQALSGRIPGLDIKSSGSNPGDVGSMTMRGHRSFVASNDPLIILDGVTFYGSLNDINPYDIKSIDVLKDASSTAIYGSKGANGVIIITTKRGNIGKPQFKLESQVGIDHAAHQPWMNAERWIQRAYEGGRATGLTGEALDSYVQKRIGEKEWNYYQNGGDTDWQDLFIQDGFRHKQQLSVSGGTERINYNIAANILQHEGVIPTRKFDRYTIHPNIDVKLTKNLKVGISTLLSYNKRHSRVSGEAWTDVRNNPPTAFPYDEDGNLRKHASNTSSWYLNPLLEVETEAYRWENKTHSAYVTTYADWQILPSLSYRLNVAFDVTKKSVKSAALSASSNRHDDGDLASISHQDTNRESVENILTFDKMFGKRHHLTLTGIHSYQKSHMESDYINVSNIPHFHALWNNIGAAAAVKSYGSNLEDWKLLSYAGRLFYSLDDKYLLTATIRTDGASQFAEGHKWGYFPSVALGWRISEELFMNSTKKWLSNLKLRLSYGVSGNQGISPYQTQGSLTSTKYSFDNGEGLGMRPGELANKELSWEKTAVYNIGLDFSFFNNRINGNIELYKSKTTNLLLYRKLPIITGFNQVLSNVGATENKGFELALHSQNIINKDFCWNTDLTFYLNREKIVELYNGKNDDIGNKWFIGQPISVFYDYKWIGIWQTEETEEAAKYSRKPGQIKVADLDGSGTVNDADRMILGSSQPDFVANMVNTFRYKNVDLSFELYCRWGHMINVSQLCQESTTNGNFMDVNFWTPENHSNDYPQPDDNATNYQQGSVLGLYKGSFIRLKNISLGYTLPRTLVSKLKLNNVHLYMTGENLWTWSKEGIHKYKIDPESGRSFPTIASYTFGLNITF